MNQIHEDAVEHVFDFIRVPFRILLGNKLADRAQVDGSSLNESLGAERVVLAGQSLENPCRIA